MFRILFFAFVILLIYWYVRRFTADAEKVVRRSKRQEKERQTGAITTLIKDPRTGEYRVPREDE
ncbi:hypothetical protein [Rhizobium paknamense]|uniref:Membrane protein implicated in regulation of membrane protease activity n=1 Tax=Rhizobium paknamense TaxID=1206817 RepID=A0ABU0I9Y1_9HYPH|nr:hypothetical protein [Rhizobium paknamense]MDQ0455022.1 membrane protein implicated in regulation of membrane protease activity [Rhizobium paknamense]